MQKVKSVKIIKGNLFFLIFLIFSISCIGQKSKIISLEDYSILNKSIERYFYSRTINDSLFYNSELYKENSESQKVIKEVELRKKRDTLYIKSTAGNIFLRDFLKITPIGRDKENTKE